MTTAKERWEELKSNGTKCKGCGGRAEFSENTFTYYCPECGWVLEV